MNHLKFANNQPFLKILRVTLEVKEHLIEEQELYKLLDLCRKGNRNGQDKLYKAYYGYSMSICLRYSRTRDEALEIVNDGFVKIFTHLDKYSKGLSFKGWLRKVMINSAIDYFRRNEKHYNSLDISHVPYASPAENILDKLSAKEIIDAIQLLPPSYRMVFNLYVIEGYKHDEIANQLNISVGTSKSNLSIARNKMKKILLSEQGERLTHEQNG